MSNDQSQLQQARTFIQQGNIDGARQILNTMRGNETAEKWLAELDRRYPQGGGGGAGGQDPERAALAQAKGLIDQKRYQEAYGILQGIPHNETAQKWMARLTEMDPFLQQGGFGQPGGMQGGYGPQGGMPGGYGQPGPYQPPFGMRPPVDPTPVPMIPQVTQVVRPLYDSVPGMAFTAGLSAIFFAITWFLTSLLGFNGDSAFVAVLVNTVLIGLFGYLMMYFISVAVPDLNLMHVAVFLGGFLLINLVYGLIYWGSWEDLENSFGIEPPTVLVLLIFILAMFVLATFAFSRFNPLGKRAPDAGLSINNSIIVGIGVALIAALPYMVMMFRFLDSPSDSIGEIESDTNLHLAIIGLFYGAFLSMFLYAMLKETSTGEKPPALPPQGGMGMGPQQGGMGMGPQQGPPGYGPPQG